MKKAFPYLIEGILTDKPWERGAENAIGIGVNNTFWVLDPRSLKRACGSSTRRAKRHRPPRAMPARRRNTATSCARRSDIPPIAELSAAGLNFGKGFTEAYYSFTPTKIRAEEQAQGAGRDAATARVRTFEVVG